MADFITQAGSSEDGSVPGTASMDMVEKSRFSGVEHPGDDVMPLLFEIEELYCRAEFEDALTRVEELIAVGDESVAVAALTYRMVIAIALADVDRAYDDYCQLKALCEDWFARFSKAPGSFRVGPYALSALLIESTLAASVFDLSCLSSEVEHFPNGLKTYFGYLLAMRSIRLGDYEKAAGIAYAFNTLVGQRLPESKVWLHLVAATSNVLLGHLEQADSEFGAAWRLGEKHGIVMPFVAMSHFLMGLPHHYCKMHGIAGSKRIASLSRTFRQGWYGVRQKCALPNDAVSLTTLEYYVAGLAALGWSNRRIAGWLSISENTVKHHLTACYQKLHVSNRKELGVILQKELRASTMHDPDSAAAAR